MVIELGREAKGSSAETLGICVMGAEPFVATGLCTSKNVYSCSFLHRSRTRGLNIYRVVPCGALCARSFFVTSISVDVGQDVSASFSLE